MGGCFRGTVSLFAIAIAAQSSAAAAQDEQQEQNDQTTVAPATGQEVTEPQPASMAPPDADEPQQEVTETIVVTGSRIPRPNLTAISPVTVVGQVEVQLEGAILAEEILNQLPQVAPSQGVFISNGASGTSTVDLRNLGAARTLVLINGRRLGPGDPGTPVADLNIIPPTLIQRVEVLTGGATSVYGSDAVSGVINFILDTRLSGLRVDGQASVFQHDNNSETGIREALERRGFPFPSGNSVDGGRQDINLAYGRGFFDDRAHVTLYAGYKHIEELRQDARDYSACTAGINRRDNSILECGGSFAAFPGNFVTNFDVFTLGPDRTFEPGFTLFNFGPWNFYQRPTERWTAGGFADAEISSAVNPYIEVMWLNDRSLAQIAPTANFGNTSTINCDNPLLSEQQRSLVCFDGNFVGQNVLFDNQGNIVEIVGEPIPFIDPVTGETYFRGNLQVIRRAVEFGGRQSDLRHKTFRAVGGVKGDVGHGITYDASFVHHRAKMANANLNDFSVSRLRRALDVVADPSTGQPVCRSVLTGEDPACVPWDIFQLGGVTEEATAYLVVPSFVNGTVSQQVANANATIDLGEWRIGSPWAEESSAVNFGVEYRRDKLDYVPDEAAQSGDLAGSPPINPVHGSTNVKELFAEARIPLLTGRLVERLAFEGGYRQSWYSAGEASFTTNAWKVALDLTAVRGLRFRGSQQRAVRAPNVVELFYPPVADFFFVDPCAGVTPLATEAQCALTGVTAGQYGRIIPIPEDSFFAYNAIGGGNLELQPEQAVTKTIGIVLEPRFLPGFNATVDGWDIRLNDAIEYVDGNEIIFTCLETGDPLFCSRIHRDPNGSLWLSPEGFIDTRLFNIGSLELRGVDIGVNYRLGLGRFGSATADFLGSYLDRYTVDAGGLSTATDCAGKFGFVCSKPIPRWRHKARLTWEGRNGLSISLNWRHTGKMILEPIAELPPPGPLVDRITAQNFFDLSALFRVQRRFAFRVGVNNIFDREPPLVLNQGCASQFCNGNTFPQWYDPLGRFLFAGFTVNF